MKSSIYLVLILMCSFLLSGCIAAAVGAGATGGYFYEKGQKEQTKNSTKSTTKSDTSSSS